MPTCRQMPDTRLSAPQPRVDEAVDPTTLEQRLVPTGLTTGGICRDPQDIVATGRRTFSDAFQQVRKESVGERMARGWSSDEADDRGQARAQHAPGLARVIVEGSDGLQDASAG